MTRWLLLATLVATQGCMYLSGGNDQVGVVGTTLPTPLTARVVDEKTGAPHANIPITFTVARGGGRLSATQVNTDANGDARTMLTLGPSPGRNIVTARAPDYVKYPTQNFNEVGVDAKSFEVFRLHNELRMQRGLPLFRMNGALVEMAQYWSNVMASQDRMYHNPNLAADLTNRVSSKWTRGGENVLVGPSSISAQSMFTAWVNSPGHFANIVGDYNQVGIATAISGTGKLYSTVNFMKA